LNKRCGGRQPLARGFFVASPGLATDEAIIDYTRAQDVGRRDGDFRVVDE
jgi:hypothetical protein